MLSTDNAVYNLDLFLIPKAEWNLLVMYLFVISCELSHTQSNPVSRTLYLYTINLQKHVFLYDNMEMFIISYPVQCSDFLVSFRPLIGEDKGKVMVFWCLVMWSSLLCYPDCFGFFCLNLSTEKQTDGHRSVGSNTTLRWCWCCPPSATSLFPM